MARTKLVIPAEAFPMGEYLYDEIVERDWSIQELADKSGLTADYLRTVILSEATLTKPAAEAIAQATDTKASTWLDLQKTYAIWSKGGRG